MIIHDFLSDAEIKEILNWRVLYWKGKTLDSAVEEKRVVGKAEINPSRDKYSWLSDKILKAVTDYNKQHFNFDISAGVSQIDLLRYGSGGKYDWHQDVLWGKRTHRKITMIIQLSDSEDYQGGELQFKHRDVDMSEFRRRGSAFLFPSCLHHRIVPLTSGQRQSVVAWVNGLRFKDAKRVQTEILKCKF